MNYQQYISYMLDESYSDDPKPQNLIIPAGTLLYHGTQEEFEPEELRGGGYDNIIWTVQNETIARTYIPIKGITYTYSTKNICLPSMRKRKTPDETLQKVREMIGVSDWIGQESAEYDEYNQLRTWKFPSILQTLRKDWDPEGKRKYELINMMCEQVNKKLLDLGFTPFEKDSDPRRWYWSFSENRDGEIVKDYRFTGRLLIIRVEKPLEIMDMAQGRDSDLLNLDYHRHDWFKEAKQGGYDGIKITDFAQAEGWGNVGHKSIGLFNTDKIKIIKVIDAQHPTNEEWG